MKKTLLLTFLLLLGYTPAFAAENAHIEYSKLTLKSVETIERMTSAQMALAFEPLYDTITLLTTGDAIFHGPQITSAYDKATDTYDFTPSFEPVKQYIEAADVALVNFEGTVPGQGYKHPVEFMFQWPDETVDALKHAGFDVLITANNHSFDGRLTGLDRTIDIIHDRGLQQTGTFKDDHTGPRSITLNANGLRIGVLALGHLFNGFEFYYDPETFRQKVNNSDLERLETIVQHLKDTQHDVILCYVHWGNEYFSLPSGHQEELKKELWRMGVDIIAGSHPHVIQPDTYQMNNQKLQYALFSMGNFISNQNRSTLDVKAPERTEDGVMMHYTFTKDVFGTVAIKKITPIPTWVHRRYEEGKLRHTVYPVLSTAPEGLSGSFEASATRTLDLVKGFRATESAED